MVVQESFFFSRKLYGSAASSEAADVRSKNKFLAEEIRCDVKKYAQEIQEVSVCGENRQDIA